jgi:predicted dehydrogenase
VYDLNRQRAEEMAAQYGTKAYGSVEELLGDPEIDAVSVCVRNADHCATTIQALRAGKHVLCEKPMTITLEECERMVKTAKECGKRLMVGHNQRLSKAHAKAKQLIDAGEIGKILTFQTNFSHGGPETWTVDGNNVWFFDKAKSAFGAIGDLGIHKTDLIQYLTGQHVTKVAAYVGVLDKRYKDGSLIGVDDNAICIYTMSGGVVGTMTASWTNYANENNATVLYGTEGVMHIYENPEYSIVVCHKDGTRALHALDQIQTNDHQTKSGVIDLWIDCLVNNREPEISGQNALYAMKAIFAAMESSETGRSVVIQEATE